MTPSAPVALSLPVSDGYRVPASWYEASEGRATVVLMTALGVGARFYAPMAEALRGLGLHVALVEQRGHGDSALRASRRVDFGLRETLALDVPAVMAHARTAGVPVYLMGHSLGGHTAAMLAGLRPAEVAGVILVGCGSPFLGVYTGKTRLQLELLVRILPVLVSLFGHYPGARVGFGGREARRLMDDWRRLACTGRYHAAGLGTDPELGIGSYEGRVLCVRLADDTFGTPAATAAVTDKLSAATTTQVVLDADALGAPADHWRWARTPAAVARVVSEWIGAAASSGARVS